MLQFLLHKNPGDLAWYNKPRVPQRYFLTPPLQLVYFYSYDLRRFVFGFNI